MATNDRHSLELSGNLVGLRSRRFQVRVLGSIPRTALDQIREALLITLAAGAQHPGSLDHPDDWPTHLDSSCSAAVTAEAAAVMRACLDVGKVTAVGFEPTPLRTGA